MADAVGLYGGDCLNLGTRFVVEEKISKIDQISMILCLKPSHSHPFSIFFQSLTTVSNRAMLISH